MSQLPPLLERDAGKKTLVLDLDETLVHSSFKPIPNPDHVLEVEVDGELTEVFVLKRPGMDAFLAAVARWYEVGVFTASPIRIAASTSPPASDDPANGVCSASSTMSKVCGSAAM